MITHRSKGRPIYTYICWLTLPNICHIWSTNFYIGAYMWSHIRVGLYVHIYVDLRYEIYVIYIMHTWQYMSHIWANTCHIWSTDFYISAYMGLHVRVYAHIYWLTLPNICHILRIHGNICPYMSHICTIYVRSVWVNTPLRRSGMARVLKGSHSFTCTPRVHPLTKWTIPAFAFPPEAVSNKINQNKMNRRNRN